MIKEEYIILRTNQDMSLLWLFYKEYFDETKHKPLLSQEEFYRYFLLWPGHYDAINRVITYYDVKFNILSINTGKQIIYV